MKKVFKIAVGCMALAALATGCMNELVSPEVDITSVRCSISQIDVEEDFATGILDTLSGTKASFSGSSFLWSAGDRIGIVPNSGSQIYFEVDDGAGTSTASFDGGDWAMKSTGTFYAYYPLYPDMFLSKNHVPVSYTGQTQTGNDNNLHTGAFWTLYTEGTTAVGNTLNFSFNHLTSFFKTYVIVPAGTYTKITFSAPSDVFVKEGYFDLSAQTPAIVGTTFTDELTLDLQSVTFAAETELTGYLVVAPVDITGVPITVTVFKDGTATYEYTLTKASAMVAAKTYAFRATALTQIASSPAQANALFASGATAVTITEPLTENATIVLPDTDEAVTLNLPTTVSTSTLTVAYDQGAASHPATLAITGPEGADLDIRTPNSTVTLNGIAYDQVTSRTAANTCIIPAGVTVNNLKVIQGGVQVYGTVSQIDLSGQEDDAIINVSGTVATLLGEDDEEYLPPTEITLNQSSINLTAGDTETLSATVSPVGAYPKVIWSSSDDTVATVSPTGVVTAVAAGSATISARTVISGVSASTAVTVQEPIINNGPEYVDLGLSVMWATCNIGASSPEEYGDYYAWGEIDSKTNYSWSTYKWGTSNTTLTKYNTDSSRGAVDNRTELYPEDDAAHIKLGGSWRMPTNAEWGELWNNCSWSWTNNYQRTGIAGQIVRSNKAGFTHKSIFLPAAGLRDGSNLVNAGSEGDYLSSSLCSGCTSEYIFWFDYENVSRSFVSRSYGLPVRAVYCDFLHVKTISLSSSLLQLASGENYHLTVTVTPANASNPAVNWSSSNASVATVDNSGLVTAIAPGTATITVESCDGGLTASCTVTVQDSAATNPAISVPDAVDLGLSVKWASFNLGASSPEEYGDYYAWGEVEPYYSRLSPLTWKEGKTGYNYDTYKWGTSSGYTKYVTSPLWAIMASPTIRRSWIWMTMPLKPILVGIGECQQDGNGENYKRTAHGLGRQ